MATQRMRLTFNIVDAEGVRAPATLYGEYNDAMTVATLLTDLEAKRAEIAAVTDGQIISCEASLVAAGQAAPSNFADSDVSQVGTFVFTTSAGRAWADVIPAFADAAIVAGHINLTNTGVAALLTDLETTGGDFAQTDRNWLGATTFKDAFLATREHRRALKRASFEVASS
jgi:hypothetical protein